MSHTHDVPFNGAFVLRLHLRPLLMLAIGVCMLSTCLPTEVASFADVQFTVDFTGRLRVPLNGSVTPSIDITIDGRPIANGQYRLESLNSQVATVDATRRAITGVQHDTTSVRVVFVSGVTGIAAPDTVIPIQVVVTDVETASSKDTLAWGETLQLTATGLDAQRAAVSDLTFNWRSSNESVVTVDDAGLATGVDGAIGEAEITAEVDGVEGSVTVAVFVVVETVLIDVPPDGDTLHFVGDESRFQAFAFDPSSERLEHARFRWASSNESVATVDSTGLVKASGAGTASISATVAGVPGVSQVVVDQMVANVVLLPSVITLPGDGETFQMSAVLTDSGGTSVQNKEADWMSADPQVVEVDAFGLITARAPSGTTTVAATSSGAADTAEVSVVTVATVEIDRTTVVLAGVGDTTQLSVVARDQTGTAVPNVPFRWSSANPQAASVDATGLVTGREREAVTITAAAGTAATASAEVSVGWLSVHPGRHPERTTYTCALASNGAAYCWGSNPWGTFGDGTTRDRLKPAPGGGGLRFKTLAAGPFHVCGVTIDHLLYCWGRNNRGQLGDGTTTTRLFPVQVAADGRTFDSVSAGNEHTCAIASDGSVYCWGLNNSGQLGDGTITDQTVPIPVRIGTSWFVSASVYYTCSVDAIGKLLCWGRFEDASSVVFWSLHPIELYSGFSFQSISAGVTNLCGVVDPGGLGRCYNAANPQGAWIEPAHINPVQLMTVGGDYICALTTAGAGYCTGNNSFGQLGDGTGMNTVTGVPIAGGHTFGSIAAGAAHTCGITTEGRLYCWGLNDRGQLGDGTTENRLEPTPVLRP